MKMKAIDARPIKKVAEAKARKKKKASIFKTANQIKHVPAPFISELNVSFCYFIQVLKNVEMINYALRSWILLCKLHKTVSVYYKDETQ